MFKSIFCFLIVLFMTGHQPVHAQTEGDSVNAGSDSLQNSSDSSLREEAIANSLLLPVSDSIYGPAEAIRKVPGSQVSKYLKDGNYAYANDPEYWKKQAPPKPGFINQFLNSQLFRWFVFAGIIGVILFGIYQLAKENSFTWFSRRAKQNNSDSTLVFAGEETDYEAVIRKFQADGNYRMAVRYLYLRLIRTIRGTGRIQFRDSSTNSEIVRAFGNHPQVNDFRFLARAYEHIFYGDYIPEQELFDLLKIKFEDFQHKISI